MRFTREVTDVEASPLVRIAAAAEALPRAYRLQYGEPDLPTAAFIGRAADEATRAGHTFYTDPAGDPELREAIAVKTGELHGVAVRPAEVGVTVGATQAIHLAIRALVGSGDNAVIVTPAYSIYAACVTLSGAEPRSAPLVREGAGFRLDLDAVERAVDDRTRLLVVNSPSNPTGWMATAGEQEALHQLAVRHGLVILSDEVYDRLVYQGSARAASEGDARFPVALSMARFGELDHLVVVNSFSKTYNMTGWRLGWAVSSEATIATLAKVGEFMTSSAPAMIQRAGITALREGEALVEEIRRRYALRRRLVVDALSRVPGVSLPEPQGAFYAFPAVEGLTDSTAFALDLLRRTGVALAPGAAFGPGGEGHLRLCFAGSEAVLEPALELLVGELRGRG